ncbi:MAG: DUF6390 family protein [Streptosporangiaceae bacterium]
MPADVGTAAPTVSSGQKAAGRAGQAEAQPSGALLFTRYAYPPNQLGYCGPADNRRLLEYGAAGVVDPDLSQLARQFGGAWPYLELIAGAIKAPDALDYRVVEAYWVGNRLLGQVGTSALGNSMEDRFRRRTGRGFASLADGVVAGGVPHHSFHVFGVYPWVGLLGDDRKAPTALRVLDRCRIRWGCVVSLHGDQAVVRSRPLTWDGRTLAFGQPVPETVTRSVDRAGLVHDLAPGDWVSLHWDWVCDRLTPAQLANLRHYTQRQLEITNREVGYPSHVALD